MPKSLGHLVKRLFEFQALNQDFHGLAEPGSEFGDFRKPISQLSKGSLVCLFGLKQM